MPNNAEKIWSEIAGEVHRVLVYDKPVQGVQLKIWLITEISKGECADSWFEGSYNGNVLSNMSGPYLIERLTEDL